MSSHLSLYLTSVFSFTVCAHVWQRFDSEKAGDREVQRTMLELLNQLDGFSSSDGIKVCR
jgi:ATP-dependent 26S proteasome regulatory subunit